MTNLLKEKELIPLTFDVMFTEIVNDEEYAKIVSKNLAEGNLIINESETRAL